MFYVIMGVSGSGKSTVGQLMGDRTGWNFYDADDFHPQANLDKMNRGIALSDRDRLPWLKKLQKLISSTLDTDQSGILACSALKSEYRQILQQENEQVVFVYLQGDYDCIQKRIKQRQGHFMNPDLLKSQFNTLEEPRNAIIIDVTLPLEQIVNQILEQIDYGSSD
ncbi:MAG: gluconokinase [Cyanobacteria bacterium P01_C01_bin.72]